MTKIAYPAHPTVPISKAVRAGDFVFTSAYGPWTFDPRQVTFDQNGVILDDGTGQQDVPFDDQVRLAFGFIKDALAVAGASLDDVVDCQCWLSDVRNFVRFNEIYVEFFKNDPPVRSVFPSAFMFNCLLEIKVVAYCPAKTP